MTKDGWGQPERSQPHLSHHATATAVAAGTQAEKPTLKRDKRYCTDTTVYG